MENYSLLNYILLNPFLNIFNKDNKYKKNSVWVSFLHSSACHLHFLNFFEAEVYVIFLILPFYHCERRDSRQALCVRCFPYQNPLSNKTFIYNHVSEPVSSGLMAHSVLHRLEEVNTVFYSPLCDESHIYSVSASTDGFTSDVSLAAISRWQSATRVMGLRVLSNEAQNKWRLFRVTFEQISHGKVSSLGGIEPSHVSYPCPEVQVHYQLSRVE